MYARISGVGSYLPGQPVSNDELIKQRGVDSTDEWIVTRTGIKSRHLAEPGCTTSDLAYEASSRALAAAGQPQQAVGADAEAAVAHAPRQRRAPAAERALDQDEVVARAGHLPEAELHFR